MPFQTPDLDDRSYEDLVAQAVEAAARACPQWTDRSPGDPLIALLEASAFLTDMLIYRVNRMPEKTYVALLNLIGAGIAPPSAAVASVQFTRKEGVEGMISLPAGTRIKAAGTDTSFILQRPVGIDKDENKAVALALHCEQVQGELLGISDGRPGQVFVLKRAPVIAETGDGLDLVIAVEATRGLHESERSLEFGGKAFRVWEAVEAFTSPEPDAPSYICDRYDGRVMFAPAVQHGLESADGGGRTALARVPPSGAEIRAWYRTGGGISGNLAPHVLTVLVGENPGVDVDNPNRASGGRDAEPLKSALARGPHALRGMETAVTARDFERAALSTRVAARARAFARSQTWRHGEPGTVEIQLVPNVDEKMPWEQRSRASILESHRAPELLQRTKSVVDKRTPLGVKTTVGWTRTRAIAVQLRAACFREEDPDAVKKRIEERVYATISPFAPRDFGQPLRASDIHELVAREPGIRYVERLRFLVEEVPGGATQSVRVDGFQPRTWYVAGGAGVYRTLDDGESWSEVLPFDQGETPMLCQPHPQRPGWLAAVSLRTDGTSTIHISQDCGETWQKDAAGLAFRVNGAAWSGRVGDPELYLATAKGLFLFSPLSRDAPRRIVVFEDDDKHGFWAVAAAPPIYGATTLAVAAGNRGGVWLSMSGGEARAFRLSPGTGMKDADVRVLETQFHGGRAFLWAGCAAEAGDAGLGCYRIELRGREPDPLGWQTVGKGWKGGSCEAIAFAAEEVFAGTNRAGVLKTHSQKLDREWIVGQIDNGLPLLDEQRLLHEVNGVAARLPAEGSPVLMAAGPVGVFRSRDAAATFQDAARTVFEDYVALPEHWLFASGKHEIDVISEETI